MIHRLSELQPETREMRLAEDFHKRGPVALLEFISNYRGTALGALETSLVFGRVCLDWDIDITTFDKPMRIEIELAREALWEKGCSLIPDDD